MASRPYIDIPFGYYEPDWGGLPRQEMPGYLVDAINVRRTPNGWRGQPSLTDVASATQIGGSAITSCHAASFDYPTGVRFFVVANFKIYESRALGTDTWQDVSPASGSLDIFGDFVRFGTDIVYTCDTRDAIKKSIAASHATVFTDLAGSPPNGRTAARVRKHLVFGGGVGLEFSVQTSAIGDHEDWPTPGTADARSKQAILEDLNPEFGKVKRILGGEKFGIVMQETALTRMTYVGGSSVYEFDTYEQVFGFGTKITSRPVTDGKLWYFYNESGLVVTDGFSVKVLSDGKINEALFINSISHPDGSQIGTSYNGVYDSRRQQIIYGGGANSSGSADRLLLAYSLADGTFCIANHPTQMGFATAVNDVAGAAGSRHIYNVSGLDRKLQDNAGATGTIALQTGYIELDPGYRVQLQGAHILGTGTGSLTLAYKTAANSAACDVLQTGFTSLAAAGLGEKKTGRASSQYIAFRITGTGAESQLIRGIRVYFERAEPAP